MNDRRIENIVSGILRSGVLASAITATTGGILFLTTHGQEAANYQKFVGQPDEHRQIPQMVNAALQGKSLALMQAGIMLLIATPIARVAFSLIGFSLERDWTYVAVTAVVLSILLYGLMLGQ